jgi:Gpi18-like mannosyltransferase
LATSTGRPNGTGGRAASDRPPAGWNRADQLILLTALVAGIAIRVVLLPTEGLRGDIDQFVGWVHHIATQGLSTLYEGTDAGPVTFGPVMAYIWALLAAIQPAFSTATDASDPAIRALMKVPASLADLGLAALVVYALRDRPRRAAIGGAVVLLVPPTWYVSAWWGQYEAIFALSALAAVIAATKGRNDLAAILIAVSLMTKPQAIAFVIPFAAWFWATGGWRGVMRAGVLGAVTVAVLWIPFLPTGPLGYLRNLGFYQNEEFNVLSLRAWNPWWILQVVAAGGDFVRDDVAIIGSLTLRHVGYLVTAVLSVLIGLAIVRDARPRTFVLGVVASVLAIFTWMTQMHERYAYAALIIVLLLIPDRAVRWMAAVLGVVFTLNLISAVPATPALQAALPVDGALGIAGSILMTVVSIVCLSRVVSTRAAADEGHAAR